LIKNHYLKNLHIIFLMDEIEESVSYASVESGGNLPPEKEFKPKNTTNYFPNYFNKQEKKRYIYSEGAVPLHEICLFLYDYLEQYISEATSNDKYYLSAITQSANGQSYYHLLQLDGNDNKLERIDTLSNQLEKFFEDIEERAFKQFLNKKNKFYRLDTDYNTLRRSFTQYLKEKNRIKDLLKNNTIKVSISN
jgi:hypothetical protein